MIHRFQVCQTQQSSVFSNLCNLQLIHLVYIEGDLKLYQQQSFEVIHTHLYPIKYTFSSEEKDVHLQLSAINYACNCSLIYAAK